MKPLIDILKKNFPTSSNRTFKTWLEQKRVRIDGKKAVNLHEDVLPNQQVILTQRPPKKLKDLVILYEDDDLIVVEKPSGLLSVASNTNTYCAHSILKKMFGKTRVHIIHRLDQFTSGVMAFALNQKSKEALKQQFFEKSAKRLYAAVLEGKLKKHGMWKTRLFESKDTKMHVTKATGGRIQLAITYFNTIETGPKFSFVAFELKTGKKNQIRVQAAANHTPIVGDKKYGTHSDPLKRLGLHALELQLTHPSTHKKMFFHSKMPPIFFKPFKNRSRIQTFLKTFEQKKPQQVLKF
ncbi:MAG: Ribosomal large subunit pseudouridine synthase D [Chlamydiae bacterium]|nr:Ribosomal large subunit pseudouridine synthase D [Chlamydiota bacterium]